MSAKPRVSAVSRKCRSFYERIKLAATFLPAAMLFTGAAQPRVLGGWSLGDHSRIERQIADESQTDSVSASKGVLMVAGEQLLL